MFQSTKHVHVTSSYKVDVICPACHAQAHGNDKYCPCCGQYLNYNATLDILRKWDLDLHNYQIKKIRDGIVEYEDRYTYRDQEQYNNVYDMNSGMNVVSDDYALYSKKYYPSGRIVIRGIKDSKLVYGLMNLQGEMIISPVCDYIGDIDKVGRFIVQYKGRYGVVDINNQNVIPIEYDEIRRASFYSDDCDLFIVKSSSKMGLINSNNELVIPFIYDDMASFHDGIISVCLDRKWGYYDTKKERLIIQPRYDKAEPFYGGCASVSLGEQKIIIDTDGFPTKQVNRRIHYIMTDNQVYGLDDNNQLVPDCFETHSIKEYGIDYFKIADKEGAVNANGMVVIPPSYDKIFIIDKDLIPVNNNEHWGIFSICEGLLMPLDYHWTWVSDGLIQVKGKSPQWPGWSLRGFYNRFGEQIIPQDNMELSSFEEGLCWYEALGSNRFGIMDKFGNYVEYHPVVENGQYKKCGRNLPF